jgi:heat shock protein HtpX
LLCESSAPALRREGTAVNRNWLRAVAVAAVCVGAAVFLAAALGGLAGIVLTLAAIAALVMAAMFLAERVALRALRARAASEVEYPALYRVVREISQAALLPVPRVYVSPAP